MLTCSPLSCLTVSIRHDTSTLTNLWASGRIFGIGGKDDVTFGLISFSTFPWLVFILLGMCFVRLARANLSFLSAASGRADVVLEAFATSVFATGRSGEGEDDLLKMLMTRKIKKMRKRRMSWRLFSSVYWIQPFPFRSLQIRREGEVL